MTIRYPPLPPKRKSGDEKFQFSGQTLPVGVLDFWRWAVSDLVGNVTRGLLAEFIVASALKLPDGVRGSWDVCDLRTPSGRGLQVKSCAYLQSWGHEELSRAQFDICARRAWDAETNRMESEAKRHADIYVFCLLHHQDKATLDPLDLTQWTFYVVPTTVLNEAFPTRKTLPLRALLALKPMVADYGSLLGCVNMVEGDLATT